MHPTSYKSMENFRNTFLMNCIKLKILDVGSFNVNGCYRPLFSSPNYIGMWEYVGMDVTAGPNVDLVVVDPYHWSELEKESFNVVISGQALEHIEFPWLTMVEIQRVMKPNGICCIICPSTGPVHRYPLDCWRIQPDGIVALARWAKLDIISISIPFQSEWSDIVFIGKKGSP